MELSTKLQPNIPTYRITVNTNKKKDKLELMLRELTEESRAKFVKTDQKVKLAIDYSSGANPKIHFNKILRSCSGKQKLKKNYSATVPYYAEFINDQKTYDNLIQELGFLKQNS
ncbi:MAG: hypothetical protein KC535_06175 [Nanoarchaeota archaeon]|nr:hypothetical protein [Nanoarchaeota archaeon]